MDPETHYAHNGALMIAYQVHGLDDAPALVMTTGPATHVELSWEDPGMRAWHERLGAFARVVRFDRRGTGLSDPVVGELTLEGQMDDLIAVMDANELERATVLGLGDSTRMAILTAATYPERVEALVLIAPSARSPEPDDDPLVAAVSASMADGWNPGGPLFDLFCPTRAGDDDYRRWWGRYVRSAVSPGVARRLARLHLEADVTGVLDSVQAPTLILHRTGDHVTPLAAGRQVAAALPRARMVELDGEDAFFTAGDTLTAIEEIEELLTGARHAPVPERVLATVLFTDIVDSTARAAELGDVRWRGVLEAHHERVRRQVDRFGGRVVKSLGDGVLATFDGPARAIRCAVALVDTVRDLGIELRCGLHAGECERVDDDDIGGLAVHIAARVMAAAGGGEVLVSSTVRDLVVGSGIGFADRSEQELRGVPGRWRLYAVTAAV